MPLLFPVLLGTGAYVLARKARQEQLAKDVSAQSKAAAGFGGSRRKRHHGGIHGDSCAGCVGFGAVAARPAPPTGQTLPAVQRTTGIQLTARPAPPTGQLVARPVYSRPAYVPTGYAGGYGQGYGGGYNAITAREAGERMAATNQFIEDQGYALPEGDLDDSGGVVVYDDDYRRDDYRHRHWY